MNPRHSSRLTTHLGVLALALAASQAGATTYSVPLQFNLNLTAPLCSLTVGGQTANATTPTQTAVTVDLTPTPLSVLSTPNTLVASIPGTTPFTVDSAGLSANTSLAAVRKLDAPPPATVTCTSGTPMTARISKASALTNAGIGANFMAGAPGSGQSGTMPVGMLMGIASFAGNAGVVGSGGTTFGSNQPYVAGLSTGSAQPLGLVLAIYGNSTTALTPSYAGLWTYSFNVNLDF